jgi:hypothetical protein
VCECAMLACTSELKLREPNYRVGNGLHEKLRCIVGSRVRNEVMQICFRWG